MPSNSPESCMTTAFCMKSKSFMWPAGTVPDPAPAPSTHRHAACPPRRPLHVLLLPVTPSHHHKHLTLPAPQFSCQSGHVRCPWRPLLDPPLCPFSLPDSGLYFVSLLPNCAPLATGTDAHDPVTSRARVSARVHVGAQWCSLRSS